MSKPIDFTYSAIMRKLRKESPESIIPFMKNFKDAFDRAVEGKVQNAEVSALMEAVKKQTAQEA